MTAVPSILVVEDNPTTRKMLRLVLVTEGYGVVEAANARAALATAERTLPDLVLQDLILPDMDGFELLRRLRALPSGRELPILALSGFLSRLEEAQTDQEGFTALLVKPIEPSRLVDAIRVYLPQRPVFATSRGEGRRLLVVDDDPVQLKLTRIHFSQLGFDVSAADSASDALIAARTTRPDVVLSDVFMPGADGFDLCLEIRRDPTLTNVPVVLVSSEYGSKADETLARRVGASALVLRTPDFGTVVPALLEALQTRTPTPPEQPSDQLALTHARLVIHQLERQAAAMAGLAQRYGIQAGQLSLLSGVADALTHKSDPDVALRDVLAATLDAAGISKGALILRDATGGLALRQDVGFSEAERSRLQDFFGHGALLADIVSRGGSIVLPSPAIPDGTSHDILAGANLTSAQIVPLVSDGRGVGAMIIGGTSRDVTSDDSVAFARAMGNQVVQSLALARSVGRLTASEQRYRTVLESASDLIAILSPDGIVREMNDRWVELTGVPKERLIGHHLREVAPGAATDEHDQAQSDAVTTRAVRTPPVEIRGSNGRSAFIEFSNTNVAVGDERLLFTIGRDVTERLRAEEALEHSREDQLRLKDEFLSHVSHELRTPVTAILQFTRILLDGLAGELTTAQREYQQIVLRNVQQLLSMINELLEVTRLATGRFTIEPERVSVSDAVTDILNTHQATARSKKVTLSCDLPPDLPFACVDRTSLRRILSILVENAINVTVDGEGVTVRARTLLRDCRFLLVEVCDGGCGVSPEGGESMFDPFHPGSTVEQSSRAGLGLGLFVCKELVRRQGGQIWFERQPKGATLSFTLPAE